MLPPESSNADERATSPVAGVLLLLAITLLVGAAVGAGVLIEDEGLNAGVEIAATGDEATVLWTEQGTANYLVVKTSNSLGNATIEAVNGTVRIPNDLGQASAETTIIVRAVNNETSKVVKEKTVDLSQ